MERDFDKVCSPLFSIESAIFRLGGDLSEHCHSDRALLVASS